MSYRPRSLSPSRSRSPDYRHRRYSPSRPLSPPSPPRRYGEPPRDYRPPPPRRYGDDDYPPRRYEDDYPPQRYEDRPPPRDPRDWRSGPARGDGRYDDQPARFRDDRDPGRDYRDREAGRRGFERYDERPPLGGMAADREEARPRDVPRGEPPREPQWERGRDAAELESNTPHYHQDWGLRRSNAPSEPARDVIFVGLDEELSENDFMGFLRTEHRALIDSVKIVRKRYADTGKMNCLGFATFATLQSAQDFVESSHPAVLMPALYAHSEPRKVRIDYASPPSSAGETHQAGYHAPPVQTSRGHDGMRDVGQPGGGRRVLLLRGLDSRTHGDEVVRRVGQEIARLLGKQGSEKQAEAAISRVVMIVDRVGSMSWGLSFVELVTTELASALLPFLLFPQHQPQGFVISQAPVAVSFAASTSFIPAPAGPLGGQFLVRASRKGGIGSESILQPDGEWCAYWHEQGGAVETIPKSSAPEGANGPELSTELKVFLGGLGGPLGPQTTSVGATTGAAAPAQGLLSGIGMQPIQIGAPAGKGKKKEREEDMLVPLVGKNVLGGEEEETDEVGKDTVLRSRTKGTSIILPTSGRKIANNISKWNTKRTEMAQPVAVDPHAPPAGMSDANKALGVMRPVTQPPPVQPAPSSSSPAPPADFDYTDVSTLATTGKVACLLCQRQFKTEEMLRKHTAQSDLHKARIKPGFTDILEFRASVTNLLDTAICQSGKQRKNAVGSAASSSGETAEQSKYRDRAAERREAFNQPDKPVLDRNSGVSSFKRKFAEAPKPPPPPAAPGVDPGKDEANKGNLLLAKMGWKSGTGLGKEGEGRVDPVMVQQFESRAGLGASKGVEAGKWQGEGGFKKRAMDMAEQRYHQS